MKSCYNTANVLIKSTKELYVPRLGSLAGLAYGDSDLSQNNFCYVNDSLKSIGQNAGYDLEKGGIVEFDDVEKMKGIAPQLGPNFKVDTNNKNGGFPILVWQEK